MPSRPSCRCRPWSPTRCAPISPMPTRRNRDLPRRPDMTTEGIEAVFLETHNWGRAAKFFQTLGFDLEFATDHNSGQVRNGDGPYVFIAEVPQDQEPGIQLVLKVADA